MTLLGSPLFALSQLVAKKTDDLRENVVIQIVGQLMPASTGVCVVAKILEKTVFIGRFPRATFGPLVLQVEERDQLFLLLVG
jgi:hypothetical protein